MKVQINRKHYYCFTVLAFAVSASLLMVLSCQKQTNPGKPTTPGDSTVVTGAAIVYTDEKPDSVILKSLEDTFYLDVNKDGVSDFTFTRLYVEDRCTDNLLGTFAWDNTLSVKPSVENNAMMIDQSGFPAALDSGAAISADSLWATGSGILLYGGTNVSGHCITTLPRIQGYWLNVADKYLGLKFIKGNNTFYGWARMTCTYSTVPRSPAELVIGKLILKDFAYNSISNSPILAGQTK